MAQILLFAHHGYRGSQRLMSVDILGWQMFQWLQFAVWPDLPVYYPFDFFEIHYSDARWPGIQKMIVAFLQWPLSVTIFGLGMLLAWLYCYWVRS